MRLCEKGFRVLLAAALALPVLAGAVDARAGDNPIVHGLTLPRGSSKVSESKYLSPYEMKHAEKFFRKLFSSENAWGGKRIRQVMNIPAAKVLHISNSRTADGWSGVNISLYRGNTYIFVIKRKDYAEIKNVRPLTAGATEAPREDSKPNQ